MAIISKSDAKKGYNKIFERSETNGLFKPDGSGWKKMEYKLLPTPHLQLPRCLLPGKDRKKYGATDEILSVYDSGAFKKSGAVFSKESLSAIIDFYKSALSKYEDWKCFGFRFRDTADYEDISQFYQDVEIQGYRIDFHSINKSELDLLVESGKVHLFEIRNQDSNSGKSETHRNNLHTTYWNSLFQNIANRPKLNGEAEIFFRKALPEGKLQKILDKSGKEVVKNFRFSREKFAFHVPITLNFCRKDEKINSAVREYVASNYSDMKIIGIDRGEKHLAYYSVVDLNGNVVEQGSLNVLERHDYGTKLDERAKERAAARQDWQTIGSIKELKEGYISQAVRKIADLAIRHNALIVLEDLNTGFKRGRQKIEKSVYQKFELALAKKLNFLVDKNVKSGEYLSVTDALQLTPPVANYGDIEAKKQVGIILYTRANYTSQTDPVTGWRKTIYLKKGSEDNIKEQIIGKKNGSEWESGCFSEIGFDGKDYFFTYLHA